MMSVLVDRKFKIVVCHIIFLYSTGGATQTSGDPGNLPLLSLSTGLGALITLMR